MFDKLMLMLIGLGFVFGFTLAEVLADIATGAPSESGVSTLITAGLLVVALLVTRWWKRRR